ncbi:DNA internalization-related competence protein ComEC/Rec2 [Castellaniella caeni]|uniref:DNA internalization-related competence protein ComEC/Rec2 n=1 Tax=Castellaniella caeni TaxID=266123 RepID=UPI00083605B0|nr:DNA internalization-related competence protein ComEC/Rec2 [Castellaniella caeni]
MIGRLAVAAGLAGVSGAHQLARLPGWPWLLALAAALLLGVGLLGVGLLWAMHPGLAPAGAPVRGRLCGHFRGWLRGRLRRQLSCLGLWLLAGAAGFVFTAGWAQLTLADRLLAGNVDRVSRVLLRVEGLPRLQPDRVRFEAEVLEARPAGVPRRVLVSWSAPGWRSPYAASQPADPPFPVLRAGQVWRMALVLRPVSAAQNQAAFDYEGHAFARGIRASATVRGTPEHVRDDDWHSLAVVADRARHGIREAMAPYLRDRRYGPVLRALAIGDQDGVDDSDWTLFNRTGLTHLVSISGSHITLLAGAGGLAVSWLWCRLAWRGRPLAERWPARRAAACAALLVAWLYCLLAGWGVPARRTLMMLAVVAGTQALQLRLTGSRVLAMAAVAVVACDPWAVLASGFWLSFGAVAVLLAVGAEHEAAQAAARRAGQVTWAGPGPAPAVASVAAQPVSAWRVRLRRWRQGLWLAARLQWAVTLALAPALAWVFHEISLVSPLANAYAIPLIELCVTPLSLLLAAVAPVPALAPLAEALAWLAHAVLEALMQPTQWLARLPTWPVTAGPAWLYLLASAGAALALWPRPALPQWLRHRRGWACLALAPMLFWTAPRPADGEWDLHALDVGQGSALLLRTARHALLFDAGARHGRESEEGSRTVVPMLRALGLRRLDTLVVSHADLDHAGGVRGVLDAVPVEQAYSSFALQPWLETEARLLQAPVVRPPLALNSCLLGAHWQVDGVSFEFLWPLDERRVRKGVQANRGSCVLRVRGAHHSLLLTGDIDARGEAALVLRGLGAVDVVVAAHHGSRTSSSAPFVTATAPRHVILQVGRWNRHGHPAPMVLARWARAGARLWRTDAQGGVNAQSRATGLTLYSVLESSRRYWHGRRP